MDPTREQIAKLLNSEEAHAGFEKAVKGLPPELRGKRPKGAPHSPWEVLEHIRIAQWDILEFTRDGTHPSPKWPEEYWPKTQEAPDEAAWEYSVAQVERDRQALQALLRDSKDDLLAQIPGGTGQTFAGSVAGRRSHGVSPR